MSNLNPQKLLVGLFFIGVLFIGYTKCRDARTSAIGGTSPTKGADYNKEDLPKPAGTSTGAAPSTDGIEGDTKTPATYGTQTTPTPTSTIPSGPVSTKLDEVAQATKPGEVEAQTIAPSTTTAKGISKNAPTVTYTGEERSILYITIDKLKMRTGPGLKYPVVARLRLHEKVYFAGERTDKKEELSLGYEKAYEPWLKVTTQSGKEGWVYGAGVDIMKTVRDGVMH